MQLGLCLGLTQSRPAVSEGGGGEEGPEPLVRTNFVTNVYQSGGSNVAVTDLLAGEHYEELMPITDFIDEDGLDMQAVKVAGGDPSARGAMLTAFAAAEGATVVMEWLQVGSDAATILFGDAVTTFDGPDVYWIGSNFKITRNGGEVDIATGNGAVVIGINRAAFTYSPTETSMSVNGGTVVVGAGAIQDTMTNCIIGSNDGNSSSFVNSHIRLIEIYEPQPFASLAAMSAL
jgi:hypothetical protein